jgi:hypothetical protein
VTSYLLDANVFIEAKNRYYSFDICPGFWEWMDQAAPAGTSHSITKVYDELVAGNDGLAKWIKSRKDGRFLDVSDPPTQQAFAKVAQTVQRGPYTPEAKRKFLSGADPWLVAKAMTISAVIVTHERADPKSIRRVPLPNICSNFCVSHTDTFRHLQKLSVCFDLRKR